jgi:FixJ family two-component response regulator
VSPKPFREQELLDGIRSAIERDRTMRAERQERGELGRRYASLTPLAARLGSTLAGGGPLGGANRRSPAEGC